MSNQTCSVAKYDSGEITFKGKTVKLAEVEIDTIDDKIIMRTRNLDGAREFEKLYQSDAGKPIRFELRELFTITDGHSVERSFDARMASRPSLLARGGVECADVELIIDIEIGGLLYGDCKAFVYIGQRCDECGQIHDLR